MENTLNPNKHAVWSPSSAEKWVNCPSSVLLESTFPNESSEFSDEGTAAHHLASYCLVTDRPPVSQIGRGVIFFKPEGGGEHVGWFAPLKADTKEPVAGTIRKTIAVDQNMADYIDQYVLEAESATGRDGTMLVEQRLSIGHITGEEGAEGTADLVILKPGELHVRDLKYGKGVQVFAKGNKQLILYALAAYDTYKDRDVFILDEIQMVTIAIHQPRLGHMDEWTITAEELLSYRNQYSVAAEQSRMVLRGHPAEDHLHPGLHCSKGFCRAQATCPALKEYVLDSCGFEDITDGMKDLDLTADELGDSKSRIPILQAWIKKVEEEAFKRLERGDPVTGYKLALGREGNREWADEQKAVAKLSTYGFTLDQLYDKKLKSPAKVKDGLKLSKQRFDELGPLISRSAPGKTVVPEDSKSPAISNTDGFENLE